MNSKGYFSWETVIVPVLLTITIASVLAVYFDAITITGYGGTGQDTNQTIDLGIAFNIGDLNRSIAQLTTPPSDINSGSAGSNSSNNQTIVDQFLFGLKDAFTGVITVVGASLGVGWNLAILFWSILTLFSPFIDGMLGITASTSSDSPMLTIAIGLKFLFAIVEAMGLWYLFIRIKSSIWRGV